MDRRRVLAWVVAAMAWAMAAAQTPGPGLLPQRTYHVSRPTEFSDTALLFPPVCSSGAKVILEARGAVQADRKLLADRSPRKWSVVWGKTPGALLELELRLVALNSDDLNPRYALEATAIRNGEQREERVELSTATLDLDPTFRAGDMTGVVMECDSSARTMTLLRDGDHPEEAMRVEVDEPFAVVPGIRVSPKTSVSLLVSELRGQKDLAPLQRWGSAEEAEAAALSTPGDPLAGVWEYFDRDTDERYMRPGGLYRLAVARESGGGYCVGYLSGAQVEKNLWKPGMKKGSLLPSGFAGSYQLRWTDSRFAEIGGENFATLSGDGSLLTLTFPALRATVRFRKVAPDR